MIATGPTTYIHTTCGEMKRMGVVMTHIMLSTDLVEISSLFNELELSADSFHCVCHAQNIASTIV